MDDQLVVVQLTAFVTTEGSEDREEGQSFFVHVGYINKKTWHFAGLVMRSARDVFCEDESVLQLAVHDFHRGNHWIGRDVEIFQEFVDFEQKWVATILSISQNEKHWSLADFTSSRVPVVPCTSIDRFIVWQGSQKEAAMRRQADEPKQVPQKRELNPLVHAERLTQTKRRRTSTQMEALQEPAASAGSINAADGDLLGLGSPGGEASENLPDFGDEVSRYLFFAEGSESACSESDGDPDDEQDELLEELGLLLPPSSAVERPVEEGCLNESTTPPLPAGEPTQASSSSSPFILA